MCWIRGRLWSAPPGIFLPKREVVFAQVQRRVACCRRATTGSSFLGLFVLAFSPNGRLVFGSFLQGWQPARQSVCMQTRELTVTEMQAFSDSWQGSASIGIRVPSGQIADLSARSTRTGSVSKNQEGIGSSHRACGAATTWGASKDRSWESNFRNVTPPQNYRDVRRQIPVTPHWLHTSRPNRTSAPTIRAVVRLRTSAGQRTSYAVRSSFELWRQPVPPHRRLCARGSDKMRPSPHLGS